MYRAALGAFVVAAVAGALMLLSSSGNAEPAPVPTCPEPDDARCEVPDRPGGAPLLEVPGDSNPDVKDAKPAPSPTVAPRMAPAESPTATATAEPSATPGFADPAESPAPLAENDRIAPMTAADGFAPTLTPTPTATPTPVGPVLYLTFDDGPHPTWTPQVLDLLADYGAQATFFEMGTNVDGYPALSQRVVDEGHALANHSYGHPDLTTLDWYGVRDQLAWTNSAIEAATGEVPTCMRPPYGAVNDTVNDVVSSMSLDMWLWNVDPEDWARPGANVIYQRVIQHADDGDVVLMHDGGGNRAQTVTALDSILAYYQDLGYRFEALPGC